MCDTIGFQNLLDATQRIAHNPPLPGDKRAIARCMQCIDDFYYQSRIDAEQWETLKNILLSVFP
jgi:hypothetical protein